ncbi:MAG: nucleotidyltransferase family protein [Thermoleophilia bacterium]|nr:nucleotidyltransferase family protein [Thermoleophilia bacterium]
MSEPRAGVVGVVLAAGAATRFGSPKQRLFLPAVLAALRATSLDEILVVSGAYRLDVPGARVVFCPEWERGPGASLACALRALGPETDAVVIVLADGPRLQPAAVERVLAAWREGTGDVVAASYGGERGHPLLLARPVWGSVGDEGARSLSPALVPCDDLGAPGDIDTPTDVG